MNGNKDDEIFGVGSDEFPLLCSLEGGKKYLDMGRSPVKAIEIAWRWADAGLVIINGDYIELTPAGKQVLKNIRALNELKLR